MVEVAKFEASLNDLTRALESAKRVLLTAPGAADGDSIGSQLALRRMLQAKYPQTEVCIINDEPLPQRYLFLPDVETVFTPETFHGNSRFDVGIIVDGGVDRAGRVREVFEACPTTVFIDHHRVSAEFPYTIRIVDETASSNTELIYYISQTPRFATPMCREFAEHIYLGLVFDTGFFRHANTTPESMELAAKLIRTGFDFTEVGERGMLERTLTSLKMLSDTLARAELTPDNKVIWSTITHKQLCGFGAEADDREGIIDHLFLIRGVEVAVLFFELADGTTKVSLRSHGKVDVARFARSLTIHGGGHASAAGANLEIPVENARRLVLEKLASAF